MKCHFANRFAQPLRGEAVAVHPYLRFRWRWHSHWHWRVSLVPVDWRVWKTWSLRGDIWNYVVQRVYICIPTQVLTYDGYTYGSALGQSWTWTRGIVESWTRGVCILKPRVGSDKQSRCFPRSLFADLLLICQFAPVYTYVPKLQVLLGTLLPIERSRPKRCFSAGQVVT